MSCPKCSGLMKFHRKWKDEDESLIYVFRCSNCNKEVLTEYPEIYEKEEIK